MGDREKKLMILKDSHVGAFAVIGCGVYMMLSVGAWSEIDADGIRIMIMAFVLERHSADWLRLILREPVKTVC